MLRGAMPGIEAAHTFIDRIRDRELMQHLLMGGDRLLNEALAAGLPARL
jgi:hypothetical protein